MRYDQLAAACDNLSRRRFLKLTGYGSLGLVAGNWLASAEASQLDPALITEMGIDVTYQTRMIDYPSDGEVVHLWMPLPPEDEGQDVRSLEITCPVPYEITEDKTHGNRMVHVETQKLEPFVLESKYHVVRRRIGHLPVAPEVASEKRFQTLNGRVRFVDTVRAFAEEAIGDAKRPIDVGRRVYDAMIDALTYDKQIAGCGMGDTEWVMKHKRGKCDDYHALFMAIMISQGIPVRWEQGFPLPYPSDKIEVSGRLSGDCSGAHCWASFYDADYGWIPVDISEGDKKPEMRDFFFGNLTPNRFKISEGRAIEMNPAQGGDPLRTFAFAYAEADGFPLIYHANYENIVQFNVTRVETV
jgi:hypothetical protein